MSLEPQIPEWTEEEELRFRKMEEEAERRAWDDLPKEVKTRLLAEALLGSTWMD